MKLTLEEEDALKEMSNIGMSKAAKQLSLLLDSTIVITIPKIALIDFKNLEQLESADHEIFSCVYQQLSGELDGYAALAFKREQTTRFTQAILGKMPQLTKEEIRACEQEALLEIGNIIISSCLSVIADLLAKRANLSLPRYNEFKIDELLCSLSEQFQQEHQEVLVVSTRLDSEQDRVSGDLFLILGEETAKKILKSIQGLIHG